MGQLELDRLLWLECSKSESSCQQADAVKDCIYSPNISDEQPGKVEVGGGGSRGARVGRRGL